MMGDHQFCWLNSAKLLPHWIKKPKYSCTRNPLHASKGCLWKPAHKHTKYLKEQTHPSATWGIVILPLLERYLFLKKKKKKKAACFLSSVLGFISESSLTCSSKKLTLIKSFALVRTTAFSPELFKAEKLQLRSILQSFWNYKRGRRITLPKTLLLKILTNPKSHQFKGTIVLLA